MARISIDQAIERIAKDAGVSEDMVRRVQRAETNYVIDMLSHGYTANLPGRGTFKPEMRKKFVVGGVFEGYIKPSFKISAVIANKLEDLNSYEESDDTDIDDLSDIDGILLTQIPDLQ